MNISVRWLNDLFEASNSPTASGAPASPAISPDEAEEVLMGMGFPIESRSEVNAAGEPDVVIDVEVTSNRGDCLSHLGVAREIAAKTGRGLKPVMKEIPRGAHDATHAGEFLTLKNQTPEVCPLFTARVIRGVKIGPSPAWLRRCLESVGQRSINNVVDITNYINLLLGNPCHAFDLNKLSGKSLIIRWAKDGEALTTLDGKKRTLKRDELVVADGERAQSLAGVIGGGDSEVSDSTTDVVFEVATWDPVTVRRAARRHQVRTDASYRFERMVAAATLEDASRLGAALIAELAGGKVCETVLVDGREVSEAPTIQLRESRVRALIGASYTREQIIDGLRALGIQTVETGKSGESAVFTCTPPAYRVDLTREVDLIEEVARLHGLAAIPLQEKLGVAVREPQPSERARRELGSLLTGLGFYETITFSFATREEAALFLPRGLAHTEVSDERRKEAPALRTSVLSGLLGCRRGNQNALVQRAGGIRLFEIASVYGEVPVPGSLPKTIENLNLALLLDVPQKGRSAAIDEQQLGIRQLRGVIEALVRAVAGAGADLKIEAMAPLAPAFAAEAFAGVSLAGRPLGYFGLLSEAATRQYDLGAGVVGAELNLADLIAGYPPRALVQELPQFPAIERDLSLVVDEGVAWADVAAAVKAQPVERLERADFVATFRGGSVAKGRKSVTMRLRFRDPARTLRHEEVDGPVAGLVDRLKSSLGAELRG